MAIGSILKLVLAFAGLVVTFVLLIIGLVKKDLKRLKKAGLFFLGTWLILIIVGVIEFLFLA